MPTSYGRQHQAGQGSQSPDFGAEIRPHSQCQKVCFFPNSRQKIPNFTQKKKKKKKNFFFFFFFLGSPSLFHIIQILTIKLNCLITNNYIIYQEKKISLIIGINLAMELSYIRTMSNFPILVKTPLIFPIPWAPAPFPKRGVRALQVLMKARNSRGPEDCTMWYTGDNGHLQRTAPIQEYLLQGTKIPLIRS